MSTVRDQWHDRLHELHSASDPSPEYRQQAQKLILKDLAKNRPPKKGYHPSVPSLDEFKITPLIQEALDRAAKGEPPAAGSVDVSRYAKIDFESAEGPEAQENLRKAYVALAYTQIRKDNLDLLSLLGKNQWLIGNDEYESDLTQMEIDLVDQQNRAGASARNAGL
ncbi:Pre-mRNA-splicing factor SPF27 [Lipomyces japonicus]|uniref:Pre-mRNA-splicing factor SPF27 n=1 Tax=Lipomyces japonicus TaxID=56871 RepID=UPI0034CE5C8E